MNDDKILVSIQCLVYNHEPYLRQCLDGFVMQKTNFRFEAIVHDDVSTDGSAAIIREYAEKYPDIIKPIYETENQYSKRDGSLFKIMNAACKGKYIALCEGDDYWIDPLKLQKQVDFLESNQEYAMIYTAFKKVDNNGNIMVADESLKRQLSRSKSGWIFYNLVKSNFIQTLTVMMRQDAFENIELYYDKVYDYPLYLHISGKHKIYFLDEITGCYRVTPTGAMHTGVLSYDYNGRHTLSCAFLAYLDGIYSNIPLTQKILFFLRSLYRLCFCEIDFKKRILKKLLK